MMDSPGTGSSTANPTHSRSASFSFTPRARPSVTRLNRFSQQIGSSLQALREQQQQPDEDMPSTSSLSQTEGPSLVERFQQFRNLPSSGSRRKKKARPTCKPKGVLMHVGLLPHPHCTSLSRIQCTKRGGIPSQKMFVNLSWSAADFREALRQVFPQLQGKSFDFCRADRRKRLIQLPVTINRPSLIREYHLHKRSALYLLPCVTVDDPDQEEVVDDPDTQQEVDGPGPRELQIENEGGTSAEESDVLPLSPQFDTEEGVMSSDEVEELPAYSLTMDN